MESTESQIQQSGPKPNPDLRALDVLTGTWSLSGDTSGTVTYEWALGGFFLVQHVDMIVFGHSVKCMEVIGHLQPFGGQPGKEICSRAYDSSGNTFDYVYEVEESTLTIWAGKKGSPSYFRGKFNQNKLINEGEWIYPGGGYKSTMTKTTYDKRT